MVMINRRRMTERRRTNAMDHILRECHRNYDLRVAIEAAHRLGYSIFNIGSQYFLARLEEAR